MGRTVIGGHKPKVSIKAYISILWYVLICANCDFTASLPCLHSQFRNILKCTNRGN